MPSTTHTVSTTTLLNADDPLIDMNFITAYTGMTDKSFPKPIKLGRSSRWRRSEVEAWMQQRVNDSRGI